MEDIIRNEEPTTLTVNDHIENYLKSGKPIVRYAEENGLSYHRFKQALYKDGRYKKRNTTKETSTQRIIRVEVKDEINIGINGCQINIKDEDTLRKVIKVIKEL